MRRILYPVLVFVITFAVFARAGGYGLINLDDYIYVSDKVSSYGLKWAFSWVGDAMWTPLTWISYWIDWRLFGENWGAYHLHNVMLQGLNGILLYFVLASVARDLPRGYSFLAALLWAIHPLRVESVVWVASRKDMLSTFFFLLALWSWYAGERKVNLAAAFGCLLLGGLAKASVMVFPAVVICLDSLVTHRAKPWWAYACAVLLSFGFAAEAAWAQKAGGALAVTGDISIEYKMLNAAASLTVYLFNLVCPTRLAAQCQLKYPAWPRFSIIGLALLIGAVYCLWRYLKAADRSNEFPKSELVAGIIIFFASFMPFLGLSGFGSHAFADRFTILPALGASIAFLWVVRQVETGEFVDMRRSHLLLVTGLLVAVLSVLAYRQVGFWRDDATLFARTVEVDGEDNLQAHEIVVMHHYENGHDQKKIYSHALALLKGPAWAQKRVAHLGPILMEAAYETGHPEEARMIYDWHVYWAREFLQELRRMNPEVSEVDTIQIADALRSVYEFDDLDSARKVLGELQKTESEFFMVKNLAVVIARRSGDRQAYAKAWEEAYAPKGEVFLKNRWALGPCPIGDFSQGKKEG